MLLKILICTFIYYTTSLSLGFISSYFLSEHAYNFQYPIFVAGCQNGVHFLLAYIMLRRLKLKMSSIPCALCAAVDIGVSSYALRTVTLAFYTMVKSSAPCFILLCGFVFGIEKPSVFLFLLMFTIGGGVFLTSFKKTKFDTHHFLLVSTASFMAGLRWSFVQYILEKKGAAIDKNKEDTNDLNEPDTSNYILIDEIDHSNLNMLKISDNENLQNIVHCTEINPKEIYNHEKQNTKNEEEDDKVNKIFDEAINIRMDMKINLKIIDDNIEVDLIKETSPRIENQKYSSAVNLTNVLSTIQELCLPISILLLGFSMTMENIFKIIEHEFIYSKNGLFNTLYIILSGMLSFTLILSEFVLVECTSIIYLSMSGIVKELIIVIYSVLRKDVHLTGINYTGLFVSIIGIVLFNLTRRQMNKEEQEEEII